MELERNSSCRRGFVRGSHTKWMYCFCFLCVWVCGCVFLMVFEGTPNGQPPFLGSPKLVPYLWPWRTWQASQSLGSQGGFLGARGSGFLPSCLSPVAVKLPTVGRSKRANWGISSGSFWVCHAQACDNHVVPQLAQHLHDLGSPLLCQPVPFTSGLVG